MMDSVKPVRRATCWMVSFWVGEYHATLTDRWSLEDRDGADAAATLLRDQGIEGIEGVKVGTDAIY